MRKVVLCGVVLGMIWAGSGTGRSQLAYTLSSGLSSWGLVSGVGLVGMATELEQGGLGLEAFLGIGTNRVQGWALWPRVYLSASAATWRPFGELPLVQLSETELRVEPTRGLVKETFTWQFMGVGLGVAYRRDDRLLRASLGLGVTGGQCAVCGLQAYASVHLGFSF